jgi:tRNA nucleotidyltransferase/poly(A) polymerase
MKNAKEFITVYIVVNKTITQQGEEGTLEDDVARRDFT